MVMIIRVSTLFVVVVLAAKAGLFVADDGVIKNGCAGHGILGPVEKKVARLIDEGMRRREEIEEAADGVANMAQAIAASAMCAIVRVIRATGRIRNRATACMTTASMAASLGGHWITSAFRSSLGMVGTKPLSQGVHLFSSKAEIASGMWNRR